MKKKKTDWAHLDLQMRAYSSFFRDEFQIAAPQSNSIATSMAQEIRNLDTCVVEELHMSDAVGIQSRLNELVGFQKWMDIIHSSQVYPAVIRAQVIVQNYVFLCISVSRCSRYCAPECLMRA
jgi:hypothetical protein